MASKWQYNAKGLYLDSNVSKFDFATARKAGYSFVMLEMNYQPGTGAEFQYTPQFADMVQQAYDGGMKMLVGVFNIDVKQYMDSGLSLGTHWQNPKFRLAELDLQWNTFRRQIMNKFLRDGLGVACVLNFARLQSGSVEVPDPWAAAIMDKVMLSYRFLSIAANKKIGEYYLQFDEGIQRARYPSTGMVTKFEPWVSVNYTNNISDLYSGQLPAEKILGFDYQMHDNPPISGANNWRFWIWGKCLANPGVFTVIYNGNFESMKLNYKIADYKEFSEGVVTPEPEVPAPDPDILDKVDSLVGWINDHEEIHEQQRKDFIEIKTLLLELKEQLK